MDYSNQIKNCDDNIIAYAEQLRAAQIRRLAAQEGTEKEAASFIEHMARKKLNQFVDLKNELKSRVAEAVEPLKER
jgi:hypothetical protein